MNDFKTDIMTYEELPSNRQYTVRLMAMDMVVSTVAGRKTREELFKVDSYRSNLRMNWETIMDVVSVAGYEKHHENPEERILYSLDEQDNSVGRRLYVDRFELGRFGAFVTLDAYNGEEFLHPHYILSSRYHSGWDELNEHYKNNQLLEAYGYVIGMVCVIWCRHIYFEDNERMFPNSKEVIEWNKKRERILKNLEDEESYDEG